LLGVLNFALDLLWIFGLPLLQFNSRGMDRCFGSKARFWGIERLTSLRFPVDKTPEIAYMGWKQLTTATLSTVRKDRK
jgi:hypothetical protein